MPPAGEWRHSRASVAGTAHLRAGDPCQDHAEVASLPAEGPARLLVAVAADGAGSAARAADGARLACHAFVEFAGFALDRGTAGDPLLDERFPLLALDDLRRELGALAAAAGEPLRDYACTLLAAVVGEDAALFLQLGDGAVVFRAEDEEGWQLALPPGRGEFHNETMFVTHAGAAARLGVRRVAARVRELALMTDGVEFLAVQHQRGQPHAPFLEHVLAGLRAAPSGGPDPGHESWLRGFLGSDAVCRRTDDDKTLVLASRAPASAS